MQATPDNPAEGRFEQLDVPFRGGRDYLHSTHILAAIRELLHPEGPVKLEFRKMIRHPVHLAEAPNDPENVAGRFSYMVGGAWKSYDIVVDPARDVARRVACNEDEIVNRYYEGSDRAEGVVGEPGTMIETIVALNKAIVARKSSKGGKVVFSAARLDRIVDDGTVAVRFSRSLGDTLYVSDVFWNDQKCGSLTFMVV